MKTTGEQIKSIRLELGETLEKFGKRFNPPANRSLVSGWENNRYTPSPERLKVIAELGGMPVKDLISTNSVGERIQRIRLENGYSLNTFGIEIGKRLNSERVKEGIISRWENGVSLPNNERLKAIAELGDITVNQLLNSNPLSDYSNEELIQELERRGVINETTNK